MAEPHLPPIPRAWGELGQHPRYSAPVNRAAGSRSSSRVKNCNRMISTPHFTRTSYTVCPSGLGTDTTSDLRLELRRPEQGVCDRHAEDGPEGGPVSAARARTSG